MNAKAVLICVVGASFVVSSSATVITAGSAAAGAVAGGIVGAVTPWIALGRVAYGPWGFGGFGGPGPLAGSPPPAGQRMAANPQPQAAPTVAQADSRTNTAEEPVYKFQPEVGFTHYNSIHYYPVKILEKTVEVPKVVEVPRVVEVPKYIEVLKSNPTPVEPRAQSLKLQYSTTDC